MDPEITWSHWPGFIDESVDTVEPNGRENSGEKSLVLLEFAIEIIPIIPYIGVVFPFMGSLSSDNFYFLMILKERLTFLPLSNPVLHNMTFFKSVTP